VDAILDKDNILKATALINSFSPTDLSIFMIIVHGPLVAHLMHFLTASYMIIQTFRPEEVLFPKR